MKTTILTHDLEFVLNQKSSLKKELKKAIFKEVLRLSLNTYLRHFFSCRIFSLYRNSVRNSMSLTENARMNKSDETNRELT